MQGSSLTTVECLMTAATVSRRSRVVAVAAVALAASLLGATPAAASSADAAGAQKCDTVDQISDCVSAEGVRAHLAEFQSIADANDGTRASGTPGYTASAEYVAEQARQAGLGGSTQDFEFAFFQLNSQALAQTEPTSVAYTAGTDFVATTFSGSGDVSGTAVPAALRLPPTGGSTSGCEAEDFSDFPDGGIALLQRGTCDFGVKARNAEAA